MFYLAVVVRKYRVFTLLRPAPLLFSQHILHLVLIDVPCQFPLLNLCLVLLLTRRSMSALYPFATISDVQVREGRHT